MRLPDTGYSAPQAENTDTPGEHMRPADIPGTRRWLLRPAARDGRVSGHPSQELGQRAANGRVRQMPVSIARRVNRETGQRQREGAAQMPKWNWVAMGQVGLTGWTKVAARPVARAVARRTGRPEAQMLALIGAGFLAISLIDFLRQVDAVIAAGRTAPSASE